MNPKSPTGKTSYSGSRTRTGIHSDRRSDAPRGKPNGQAKQIRRRLHDASCNHSKSEKRTFLFDKLLMSVHFQVVPSSYDITLEIYVANIPADIDKYPLALPTPVCIPVP